MRTVTVATVSLNAVIMLSCASTASSAHLDSPKPSGFTDRSSGRAPNFVLLPLPYSTTALMPFINEDTLKIHHGKHVQAYVDKANSLTAVDASYRDMTLGAAIQKAPEGALLNQLMQVWNHAFYFHCMYRRDDDRRCTESSTKQSIAGGGCSASAVGGSAESGGPSEALRAAMAESGYNSAADLKRAFLAAADRHFGSGFTWLVVNENKLNIYNTDNANNPVKDRSGYPLIAMDIWEHSYYLDYQNRRAAYTTAFWDLLDWGFVNEVYSRYLLGSPIPFLE